MSGDAEQFSFVVPSEDDGARIDTWLASRPELDLTRSKVQKLITDGLVSVAGRTVSKNYRLSSGDSISLTVVSAPPSHVQAEDIPLNIVFADDHLAVIDKPAGMVTHPAVGHASGTLVNAVMHRFGLTDKSGKHRPGIVHRLDKETSGLILIALTEPVLAKLQEMIKERTVHRTYTALVWGHMPNDRGEIDAPIGRSARDRKRMAVTDQHSRAARTGYRVVERYRSFDLLQLTLHTGRTHQIRVHLAHLGHPVFGDPDYGGRDKSLRGMFAPERPSAREMLGLINRQALHAAGLELIHPVTGERHAFTSDLPSDIAAVIDRARQSS